MQVLKEGGKLLPFRGTIGVLCIHMGRGWIKIFEKFIMRILKITLQVGKWRFTSVEVGCLPYREEVEKSPCSNSDVMEVDILVSTGRGGCPNGQHEALELTRVHAQRCALGGAIMADVALVTACEGIGYCVLLGRRYSLLCEAKGEPILGFLYCHRICLASRMRDIRACKIVEFQREVLVRLKDDGGDMRAAVQ